MMRQKLRVPELFMKKVEMRCKWLTKLNPIIKQKFSKRHSRPYLLNVQTYEDMRQLTLFYIIHYVNQGTQKTRNEHLIFKK